MAIHYTFWLNQLVLVELLGVEWIGVEWYNIQRVELKGL